MEYRKLGNSNLELSAITYGAFAIGGNMWGGNEERDSIESVVASLENGVTTLDTAPFYGFGLSEEIVGKAIKGRDRSKIQLLTKFGMIWDGRNNGKGNYFFDTEKDGIKTPVYKYAGKASVIQEVENSLVRLGTDYIDLLQIHWPDSTTPIEETMEAMEMLLQQGKIRAAGVCNYSVEQLQTANKTVSIASNQVPYSMLKRDIEKELVPFSIKTNSGIIAYSPMERGLLTGKYFTEGNLKSNDHRNNYFGQFDMAKVKAVVEALIPIAESKKVSVPQLVLRWTTLQLGITVVLAGARNAAQATENAAAIQVSLSAEELTFINQELIKGGF